MGCKTLGLTRCSTLECTIIVFIGLLSSAYTADVADTSGCSYHAFHSCHEDATCVDLPDGWKCVCPEGIEGDGIKGENHTGCGPRECKFTASDCHPHAECNSEARCKCKEGYTGDGWNECLDIDECKEPGRCHKIANCSNTEGGYKCFCDNARGYYGDGLTCTHTCNMDYDCHDNQVCRAMICVCAKGFETDATGDCVDINECDNPDACHEHADCINKEGDFECVCKNGYDGDGTVCEARPRNCHEIKTARPKAYSGTYDIDPDGVGPLGKTEVVCKMRPGLGITVVYPTKTYGRRVYNTRPTMTVEYTKDIDVIKAIINTSGFCYQNMKYSCRDGATLMDGDDYWIDGNGVKEENWGGATLYRKCACGQLGYCNIPDSACNCNNRTTERAIDAGKLTDKSKLPITKVSSKPGKGRAYVQIGRVMCAPKPFDIPTNCDDAKFNPYYRIKQDGAQVVDFDGPDGSLDPLLVHCDMESFKHVGITVVPHSTPYPVPITQPGVFPIEYRVDKVPLTKLVETSTFCTQEAGYTCVNSRLMNNGDKKAYFTDTRGDIKDYWPGGMGRQYKCGCGVTRTCTSNDFGCNCDVKDGVERKDFGPVVAMEDLPIGSLTFLEVGGNSNGTYYVGPLKCANREFGIPATCQHYVDVGYSDSYTYLIDPDGPADPALTEVDNQDAFPVYCEITLEPPYAKTIVYHDTEGENAIGGNGILGFEYRNVIIKQLEALVKKAVTCLQSVKYTCKKAPLHDGGSNLTTWQTTDGRSLSYFAGDGSDPVCACGMTTPNTCAGKGACNCDKDDTVIREDTGSLTDKEDLPVMSVTFSGMNEGTSQVNLEVGPLICREIFPNCADMKVFNEYNRLESETIMKNGYYTIDPDGEGSVEPFVVECMGTKTTIPVNIEPKNPTETDPDNPEEPVSTCYDITYSSGNGQPVTPEQVQALVESSEYCGQELKQDCMNAPLTDHSNFTTCDGKQQPGWAGSKGKDMCSCGVTGSCAGGKDAKCNCDLEDGEQREDGGWMLDPNRLAVCEVCVSLDPTSSLPSTTPPERRVMPTVSDLFCDKGPLGKAKSCQDWRNDGMTEESTQMLDPDGDGPMEPTPFFCGLNVNPPTGWTEIRPKEPEHEVPPEGIDVTIEYYVFSFDVIEILIQKSGYCTQEVFLECQNSNLELTGIYGWYSRDGEVQSYWAGNEEATYGCAGGQCNCNQGGFQVDGGLLINDDLLPVSQIKLGPAPGTRKLKIGPLKCFDIFTDCEAIRKANAKTNPLKNNVYTIDPDQAGGEPYFGVICDFKTDSSVGITKIKVIEPNTTTIKFSYGPGQTEIPIEYESATPEQIHALANISGYCYQGVQYTCYKSPLINFNDPAYGYYTTSGGEQSPSFGVAGASDTNGCACMITKTCPEGHGCHCDAIGKMTVDYGHETNTSLLPITTVNFGGQKGPTASSAYKVTDVRCGPRPFDLPEDCHDAYERGYRTGEHLIQPSNDVEPFLVYCDMDIVPSGGVTVVGNDFEVTSPVTFDSNLIPTYHGADIPQLVALTKKSKYCYQAIKYDCLLTKLLSESNYFFWRGGRNGYKKRYLGSGRPSARECSCGKDNYCGGSEERTELEELRRPCNCDASDNNTRADAGVFNSTYRLPIKALRFREPGIDGAMANITLGKFYCTEKNFDIDECKTGFHDCHERAKCINRHGYFECRCKRGWQALGRPELWANGRNCYDDDECAMNKCPWNADCFNYPGTYKCVCKEGFKQIGARKCEDIDECAIGTHTCHKDARCINLIGSYECRCKRNFRGNGTVCEPLALCSCFGDVHCITFDTRLIDYQGTCQYQMVRDNCENYGSTPTFELLANLHDRGLELSTPISWMKDVTFNIYNYSIQLRQGNEIWLNGKKINAPYRTSQVNIRAFGNYVEIYTDIGVEVSWDGEESVELNMPGAFKERTCGLCGNYNGDPEDDMTIGPQCPETEGEITTNFNVFGNSWVIPDADRPECASNCTDRNDTGLCTGMTRVRAEMGCDRVFDENGLFKECLREMDRQIVELFERSCIYDLCRMTGDMEIAICESAEKLVVMCINQYGVNVTGFRRNGFCEMACGANMVYKSCGSANQRTCADIITDTTPDFADPMCVEGCICRDGFMLEGDRCVESKDCGCIYEGMYLSLGETLTIKECNTLLECQRNNTIVPKDIDCHEKATCEIRDGIFGCHCKKGYYGDGMTTCIEDPCLKNPCGVNETCTRKPESTRGFECSCQMGFMGECGACEEIDECKAKTHDCPSESDCVNTVGSYKCECKQGFTMFAGKCEDENECEIAKVSGVPVCRNNSKCSNKIGGYECPCCAGYEQDAQGNCVESNSDVISPDAPICCVCNMAICNRRGPVCGEDGKQYDSIRDMVVSRCEENLSPRQQLAVDYYGPCQSSCSPSPCPLYQACKTDEKTGKPTCVCEDCSGTERVVQDVCTKKLDVYPSMCLFKKAQCQSDSEVEVHPDMKPCEKDDPGVSPVGPWTEWGDCSVTCGSGTSTRTRPTLEEFEKLPDDVKSTYDLSQSTECFQDPCPDSPCANQTCPNKAFECVEDKDGNPKCVCPKCEHISVDPVCGYVSGMKGGVKPIPWNSECHLRQYACEEKVKDFELMHSGQCGETLVNCTRVPRYEYIKGGPDNSYVSKEQHNLYECEGGCGRNKHDCCEAVRIETVSVPIYNAQKQHIYVNAEVVRECDCIEETEIP